MKRIGVKHLQKRRNQRKPQTTGKIAEGIAELVFQMDAVRRGSLLHKKSPLPIVFL